jgi:hypothetical protein
MEQHSIASVSEESERTVFHQEPESNPQRRCHGPECRQAPTAPMQPLPIEVNAPTNDACLAKFSRKLRTVCGMISAWELSNDAALNGHRNALERPPQFDL